MTYDPFQYGNWVPNDYSDLWERIILQPACLDLDDSLFTYTLRRGSKSKLGGVIIDAEIR